MTAGALAQGRELRFLGDPIFRIGAVAQNEKVEPIERPGLGERCMDRLDPADEMRRRFVVSGHQQRGPGRKVRQRSRFVDPERAHAAAHEQQEPGKGSRERERDPGEQENVEQEEHSFEIGQATDLEYEIHLVPAERGQGQGREQQGGAPSRHPGRRTWRLGRLRRRLLPQRLDRHRERRSLRQSRKLRRGRRGRRVARPARYAVHR